MDSVTGTPVDRVDTVVVGAGVVGLAIARLLAQEGREVVVLEAADDVGTATSARNSGVIHAGIYYPRDSLKAELCVRGRALLYDYCLAAGVDHRRIGKLIVAQRPDQVDELRALRERGLRNGVEGLTLIDRTELAGLEPAVAGVGALLSESTGIIDVTGLVHALRRDLLAAGGIVVLRSAFRRAVISDDGFEVEVGDGDTLGCRVLINSAGLGAWEVAQRIVGFPGPIPPRYLAKGNYFSLPTHRKPFSQLIYPLPVDGGLGIHVTLDLDGTPRFGPDVEWVADIDHRVDPDRAADFAASVARYWPELPAEPLVPAYAGIRPKLSGPGSPAADFAIHGPTVHRIPGLINLFGMESPGLTASLAIAEAVAVLLIRP